MNQAMTPEIYTIIGVAIGLAGLILSGQRTAAETRRELGAFREQMSQELGALREQTSQEIVGLREHMNQEFGALRERMAHLEGLLEGLREAIIGKAA